MSVIRRIASVSGVIQGVGFRPFVARLARDGSLTGAVRNEGARVRIDVEGRCESIERFARRLLDELPSAARVERIEWKDAAPTGASTFSIDASARDAVGALPIPPDLATCTACLAEVRDPAERRHGYPFTNCTACGPRFTIVEGLPYDRARTTMRSFALCEGCASEYRDEADRRHHAQPIACPSCGPTLRLTDARDAVIAISAGALDGGAAALARGEIVALKGLGGYQLICDATDPNTVRRLRERKRRPRQPLAILVRDVEEARRLAFVSDAEAAALRSAAGPIVLVRRRGGSALADGIAPGLARVGLLLPTTPLHHLIVERARVPLVCTSGNLHDEPIAIDDAEARRRLGSIADVFLSHDRAIARRADDGVVHVIANEARVLRLGRGLGPVAIAVGGDGVTRLCVGAHLKSTPALTLGDHAVVWPYVGDLDSPLARAAFEEAIRDMQAFLSATAAEVVRDRHPDYASSLFAERTGLPLRIVFHHHAHVAACLAEHAADDALGFAWDGFGLGDDGGLWGGETLAVDGAGAQRVASLTPFALPGGDAAARDGRRALAGVLLAAKRMEVMDEATARYAPLARSSRLTQRTSSVGRLFDAVAALTGVCPRSSYEGQAAMELEAIAEPGGAPYPSEVADGVIDWRPMIDPLLADIEDPVRVASRFHATLTSWIVTLTTRRRATRVALSGGCFQNARLAEDALAALASRGIEALLPSRVPTNDGGIALGQAWIAARSLDRPIEIRSSRA